MCTCVCVLVVGGDTINCVCIFGNLPIPMSSQLPPVPGSAQQLQRCSLQQWCPSTTHYLEGFSLSRCYSGRNGVKLRCKERLDSIGSLSQPLFMISVQNYTGKAGVCCSGGLLFVPRVCSHSFSLVTNARRRRGDSLRLTLTWENILSSGSQLF